MDSQPADGIIDLLGGHMKLLDKLEKILLYIVGTAFVVLFAINLAEILYRAVFGKSLLWVVDFSQFIFIWIMMLSATIAMYRGDHVLIDYFKEKLPTRMGHLLDLLTRLCFFGFYIILIVVGFTVAGTRMGIQYVTLGWPTGLAYYALPVSGIFMVLFILPSIWKHLQQIIRSGIPKDQRSEVRG
jgi:TRAP-type C4-dicarboxylate transport system permease small subunit